MLPSHLAIMPYLSARVGSKLGADSFQKLGKLGRGGFSKVYLVRKKDTGKLYAMKVIIKSFAAKWSGELVRREFQIMSSLNHPGIVKMYYSFSTERSYNFVMEYCPRGNLYQVLKQERRFDAGRAILYFAELLEVFNYLHTKKILFRDLKVKIM